MEKPNLNEHSQEGQPGTLILDTESPEFLAGIAGRSIDSVIKDMVKVFAIVKNIAEKSDKTREKILEEAAEMFDEFDVTLELDAIFSPQVIEQVATMETVSLISFELNGKTLDITPGATPDSVYSEWKGPETKKRDDMESEVPQEQAVVDSMLARLQSLDLTDTAIAFEWLCDYSNIVSQDYRINAHKDSVIAKFESNGYDKEKNNAADLMVAETLTDKKLLMETFIGFMLVNIGLVSENRIKQMKEKIGV